MLIVRFLWGAMISFFRHQLPRYKQQVHEQREREWDNRVPIEMKRLRLESNDEKEETCPERPLLGRYLY